MNPRSFVVDVAALSREVSPRPATMRAGLRIEFQEFAAVPQASSAATTARRCTTPVSPFKSASEIRGGVRPLLELRRRWSLPDGHEDKLRIVRATPEDVANAARDPDSVHPNLKLLQEERKAAAAAAARVTAQAAAYVVPVFVWHPFDSSFVGLDFTSTQTRTSDTALKRPRSQRSDTCKRRKRASDASLQVRKRLPMRGVISMRSVIPGVNGTAGGDERAAKRVRLDDCPVEDTIEDFVLSSEFGGRLSLA